MAAPDVVTPGQSVTLKWYFTGDRVTVSGGRFGNGVVVTGRQSLTDRPTRTTRYQFDVIFHGIATSKLTDKPERKLLRAHYSVVVNVFRMPTLQSYHAGAGWKVDYVKGWQCDNVPTQELKRDGLVFFQPEDDSVERLGIAVLPVKNMTAADLMQKAQADVPNHYNEIQTISSEPITYRGVPAILTSFSGMDLSHPGTRTQSLVLAFVRGGFGYVVSARTVAARYHVEQPFLDRMVRSFVAADTRTASSP